MNKKETYINWKYGKNNPLITLLELYPEKKWDWTSISQNPNIDLSYISDNFYLPWEWSFIKLEDDPKNGEKNTFFYNLSKQWLCWSEDFISLNPDITIEDILKTSEKYHKNTEGISSHPNISVEDMLKYSHIDWDWGSVSENPNLTLKIILKHPEKNWSAQLLSKNEFLQNYKVFSKSFTSDIKSRKEKIKALDLFGSLNNLVEKYVGYI